MARRYLVILVAASFVAGVLADRYLIRPPGRYQLAGMDHTGAVLVDTRSGHLWLWTLSFSRDAGTPWRPRWGPLVNAESAPYPVDTTRLEQKDFEAASKD